MGIFPLLEGSGQTLLLASRWLDRSSCWQTGHSPAGVKTACVQLRWGLMEGLAGALPTCFLPQTTQLRSHTLESGCCRRGLVLPPEPEPLGVRGAGDRGASWGQGCGEAGGKETHQRHCSWQQASGQGRRLVLDTTGGRTGL